MRNVNERDWKKLSAQRVRRLREEERMSQEEFAAEIEVSTNTIARVEAEDTHLSTKAAVKICKTFHVSMDYLYGFSDYKEGEPPCSLICGELLNAQSLIEMQEAKIKDLRGKLDAIQDVLNGNVKIKIKLETPDGSI